MGDLEFQRELSPDQLHEGLSLLDGRAGAKIKNLQAQDLSVAEEVDPGAGQVSAPVAAQDRFVAAEDPNKRLNRAAIAFCGLGIAAAGTLALLLWSEPPPTPPSLPGIAHEQASNEPPAQLVKDAPTALPAANSSPDHSPGGSQAAVAGFEPRS